MKQNLKGACPGLTILISSVYLTTSFQLKIFFNTITAKIHVSEVSERWKLETSRLLILFLAQCRDFPAKLKNAKLFRSKVNNSLRGILICAQNVLLRLLDFAPVNFPDK